MKELQDYQKKVIEEKQELDNRIKELRDFVMLCHKNKQENISSDEFKRLIYQYEIMVQYSSILNERIICW